MLLENPRFTDDNDVISMYMISCTFCPNTIPTVSMAYPRVIENIVNDLDSLIVLIWERTGVKEYFLASFVVLFLVLGLNLNYASLTFVSFSPVIVCCVLLLQTWTRRMHLSASRSTSKC